MSTAKKIDGNSSQPKQTSNDTEAILTALNQTQAVIEFKLDGTILSANDNFLAALGYDLKEIQGNHHRMFCDEKYIQSKDYEQFWKALSDGETFSGEFKRITKEGKEIWINASYNPIFGENGKPYKVVKFATDVTGQKRKQLDQEGQILAIDKSQAVIEFNLDGTIINANDNFLAALGYSLKEIQGHHHRMFCDDEYANSLEYKRFWDSLGRGDFHSGEFRRVTKTGEDIWINATYNPICDDEGRVFKVVKFATDITEQKMKAADYEGQIKAIDKSQAVIEFNPNGTILKANANFLSVTGYSLNEIVGQHHRIFCDQDYVKTQEYRNFWDKLSRGEFDSGEYKRFSKEGKEVWINASYNPVFDLNGHVYKVVKYATDLTKEKEAYNNLVNSFERAAENLKETSGGLQQYAQSLSRDAESTLELSRQALVNSEEVSQGVQTVSTSTEEMSASIKELSRSAVDTSVLAQDASENSKSTCDVINNLGKASEDIGNVIKVINSIAQQTNLLALNATIEAARAGEAGKGFAVVANEVKELAKQTAMATDNISNQIGNVQQSTTQAVAGVETVADKINQLSEISLTTASAVEEQAQTTSSMSQVLLEQNMSVSQISQLIEQVTESANKSFNGAQESLKAAQRLDELATNLRQIVESSKR